MWVKLSLLSSGYWSTRRGKACEIIQQTLVEHLLCALGSLGT